MPRIRSSSNPEAASEAAAAPWAYISGAQQGLNSALSTLSSFLESKQPSPAQTLKNSLGTGLKLHREWKHYVLPALEIGGAVAGPLSTWLSPVGPGGCDHNHFERCANCATSAPFVMVGVHALRNRRTLDGKVWGASMCAVGMASVGFHGSQGKWRTLGRRMDYWSIALSSNLMVKALYPNLPPAVTAAGVALTPFKPFLVSTLNTAAMELKFLDRARNNKKLRNAQRVHAASSIIGLGCWFLEEFFPEMPFIHSAWHCCSATAVAHVNHLMDDVERNQLRLPVTPLTLTDK